MVWKGYLDHVIGLYTTTPPEELDEEVLSSLRVGAVQLLKMRIPVHAAVSATVSSHESRRSRGLVNAVLRKVAAHEDDADLPLYLRYSHPEELVERWMNRYGAERTEKLLQWNNSAPEIGGYSFGRIPDGSEPGRFLERYRIIPRSGRFRPPEGFYVQDEAAALVAMGTAGFPGDTVLEIGAAPGGKTCHLVQGSMMVVSLDSSAKRMRRWQQNSRRLGWKTAYPVVASSSALPFSKRFDKVLVDAPCSNTGVYRRRFDARWNWSPEMQHRLLEVQREILSDASRLVAPGGLLVYSTCSLEPEENSGVADEFLDHHGDFIPVCFPAPEGLADSAGRFSYLPSESGLDGLFAAAWIRKGTV